MDPNTSSSWFIPHYLVPGYQELGYHSNVALVTWQLHASFPLFVLEERSMAACFIVALVGVYLLCLGERVRPEHALRPDWMTVMCKFHWVLVLWSHSSPWQVPPLIWALPLLWGALLCKTHRFTNISQKLWWVFCWISSFWTLWTPLKQSPHNLSQFQSLQWHANEGQKSSPGQLLLNTPLFCFHMQRENLLSLAVARNRTDRFEDGS